MEFVAKQVKINESHTAIEIFINDPTSLGGTRIFYFDGAIEELNNKDSWIHNKITEELDRFTFLRDRAISRLNYHFFELSAFEGGNIYDKESMMGLLNKLGIDLDVLLQEGEDGASLNKIHSLTVCKAIHFNEEPDCSNTYAEVEDPIGTLWTVADDYIEYS